MRAADRTEQRDLGNHLVDGEGVGIAIRPVRLGRAERDFGLYGTAHEVRWDEDFDAVLLREAVVFGVGAGDEDAAVVHEYGFRVIHAGDGGVCQHGETVVEGACRVVEHGVEIRVGGLAEACLALMRTVEDDVGAVW